MVGIFVIVSTKVVEIKDNTKLSSNFIVYRGNNKESPQPHGCGLPYIKALFFYLYSSQLLMSMSSSFTVQNAVMKALARRGLVINGTLRSMAARRIL